MMTDTMPGRHIARAAAAVATMAPPPASRPVTFSMPAGGPSVVTEGAAKAPPPEPQARPVTLTPDEVAAVTMADIEDALDTEIADAEMHAANAELYPKPIRASQHAADRKHLASLLTLREMLLASTGR